MKKLDRIGSVLIYSSIILFLLSAFFVANAVGGRKEYIQKNKDKLHLTPKSLKY